MQEKEVKLSLSEEELDELLFFLKFFTIVEDGNNLKALNLYNKLKGIKDENSNV